MFQYFGTDGIRGRFGETLTFELAGAVAKASADVFTEKVNSTRSDQKTLVIGRDPRESGPVLQEEMTNVFCQEGINVIDVGIVPTAALAFLTKMYEADFGVMLTASHNPASDNGIKLFDAAGVKLSDVFLRDIEERIHFYLGTIQQIEKKPNINVDSRLDALDMYCDHIVDSIAPDLGGLKVVVDCANGAASIAAPKVYKAANAKVQAIFNTPNGQNINESCGSVHIETLQQHVLSSDADLGISHDGDADRCLLVARNGTCIDGDEILAGIGVYFKMNNILNKDTIVSTVMSNFGLKVALRQAGINLLQTSVGDKHVLDKMLEHGYNLGGEQSGHIILYDHSSTGDGILTALMFMHIMATEKKTASDIASVVKKFPQFLVNVPVTGSVQDLDSNMIIQAAKIRANTELADKGRVLIRASGTESLVRIMVEAVTSEQAKRLAQSLASVVYSEYGS